VSLGAKVFGGVSAAFILFLLGGLLLPGTWKAETVTILPAPPSAVFPYLNGMEGWVQWNPMPESGSEIQGPPEGVGATLSWDDAQYGKGEARILASEEDGGIEYEVLIEGGSLRIQGSFLLAPEEGGTRLQWVETGDFGWNPLLGYAARGMGESQAEAMRWKLETLRALLEK